MRYKKYILILLITLFIGCNNTYAAESCYYETTDKATLVQYNTKSNNFIIKSRGNMIVDSFNNEPLINKGKNVQDPDTTILVESIASGCPNYIVYRRKSVLAVFKSDGVWGFSNQSTANNFLESSTKTKNMDAWILSYKDENGNKITAEQFNNDLKNTSSGGSSNNNQNQSTNTGGEKVDVNCNELFGSKDDPNSIRYLINEILWYPRVIVPVLILVYTIIDLFKAVIASKEDEMRKAQTTIIKRLIIGVAFFLIPSFIDIFMGLADIAWKGLGYSTCGL